MTTDVGEDTTAPTNDVDTPPTSLTPFAAMVTAVAVSALLPFLGSRDFYLAGDSIGQWLPVGRRIGELLRAGESHLMDLDLWRGGNFAAEARFGHWNPVALLMDVTILQLDDLAVAALLANLTYLLLLAAGTYLLCREYGAAPWTAALGGVVVSTGGWTLWMDASWWTPHLASLAFVPFVWVTARRLARGVGQPILLCVAGALCVTAGNPYSNIVVLLVVVAVAAEFGDLDRPGPVLALGGSLAAIALVAIFVHVPFQQTSGLGPRTAAVFNDGSWSPGAGDLLLLSSPTATPFVRNFSRPVVGFPAVYFAWFLLPLAPWLRWRTLARREFAGLVVFGAAVLVLTLGPSNFWFFRWPMRLLPSLYLPLTVAVAVVLGRGLVDDRRLRRAGASAAIIASGTYLAWADVPSDLTWHLAAAGLLVAASAFAVAVHRVRPAALVPVLMLATVVVLVFQLQWRPLNASVRHFSLPTSAATYEERFADRYSGNVVQIGSFDAIAASTRAADGAYADLTVGSTFSIAGVESVSSYSGIGFNTHDAALCLRFDGAMCEEAWERLWSVTDDDGRVLADLIGADTVVVQRVVLDTSDVPPPENWQLADSTEFVDVWTRAEPRPWPAGRLTGVSGPIVVSDDRSLEAHREVVTFRRSGDGPALLTFARLAWPGYEATLDGRVLPVGGGLAGLLTVTVPSDVTSGDIVVTWTPPYWRPALLVLATGVTLALGTQTLWRRYRSERSA